jgi:E3 ubiquitin-protein ligase BRE1
MLEYRRAFEAEQKRAHELEEQHRILEASIQAVEVCWTQVVNAVQSLAGHSLEVEGSALEREYTH